MSASFVLYVRLNIACNNTIDTIYRLLVVHIILFLVRVYMKLPGIQYEYKKVAGA